MSHIVSIKAEIRDEEAVRATCKRLQLEKPVFGSARLFQREETGLLVQLKDWRYPLVCDLEKGTVQYDNYEGRWGEKKQLDRFIQGYVVEKTKIEARRQGFSAQEQTLADGSIRLTLHT